MLITIIVFIIVLGLLVFVHELGHFLTAKKAGCQVDEFGFGFPPRLFGIKRGETIYSINLIPLGGFVKIVGEDGEDDAEHKNPRSFSSKPLWQRFVILAAGVAMNMVLAVVLLSIVYVIGVPTEISDNDTDIHNAKIQVLAVTEKSPAQDAGLQAGDEIVGVENVNPAVEKVSDFQAIIEENKGKEITIDILRGNESQQIKVTPRNDPPAGEGSLGIGLARTGVISFPVHEAIWQGIKATGFITKEIIISFGTIVKDLFTSGKFKGDLAGPVGIAVLTGQAVQLGAVYVLQFAALLSINLAIINVLPFPGLDGGRALFVIIESIRKKKMDKKVEGMIHGIGFSLLLVFMIIITFKDVARFSDRFVRVWERFTNLF